MLKALTENHAINKKKKEKQKKKERRIKEINNRSNVKIVDRK